MYRCEMPPLPFNTYFRMMNDMLDDDIEDDEADEVVSQVFDEIGLDISSKVFHPHFTF